VMMIALPNASAAQESESKTNWDIGIWAAGSTGEELTNSFAEAQLLSAGVFVGRVLTPEIGQRWRRGCVEYGITVIPVLSQFGPELLYGGGFEPVILRWNSRVQLGRMRPYLELAGGALRTTGNLPSGDTSSFNFTAKGGGGLYIRVHSETLDVGIRWSHISN